MLRAVSVTVSVALIALQSRVRLPNHSTVSSTYQQSQSFPRARPRSIRHKLASDIRRDASLIDTCVECLLVSRLETNDTKKTYISTGYGTARGFSLAKPINSTSWTNLLQVHGIISLIGTFGRIPVVLQLLSWKRSRRTITRV